MDARFFLVFCFRSGTLTTDALKLLGLRFRGFEKVLMVEELRFSFFPLLSVFSSIF